MSIKLPSGLPAQHTLRAEGIDLIGRAAPEPREIRPLQVGLLNLMPEKAITETQFARLLGASPFEVELTLFVPDDYASRNTPAEHLASFYRPWSRIKERTFDGLIVTGAPVETLPFEEVRYWRQLTDIFDWTQTNVGRSYYICWAAQAALHHFHGVPKHCLQEKLFGVYPHRLLQPTSPLLRGFDAEFPVPVSRHTEIREADLPPAARLEVLAQSSESGLCLIDDQALNGTYMFNHLEYDTNTLAEEYLRDLRAGKAIRPPRHYYPDDDPAQPPRNGWRPYAHLIFPNWLGELQRRAVSDRADDEMMTWLLAEPKPCGAGPEESSDFLVYAEASPDPTPALLRRLADERLSPLALKVHSRGGGLLVELRIDALSEAEAEHVSRALLKNAGVRKVTYRNGDGGAGIFVAPHGIAAAPERQPTLH
jgi:homoserine O-succinyltransferase